MRGLTTSPTPILPGDSGDLWQPMARRDHLVMNQVGEEVLVYDETTHAIHHLNPTSHAVWAACDGTRTSAMIAQAAGAVLGAEVSDVVVRLALSQLVTANLLVGKIPTEIEQPRHSRRTVLRRMAVAGGVALPVLASISAPAAADSHSSSCEAQGGRALGASCTESSQCCTGNCAAGFCAVFIPPTPIPPDTAACGRRCSSNGDCGGVCGRCTNVGDGLGGPLFVCQP